MPFRTAFTTFVSLWVAASLLTGCALFGPTPLYPRTGGVTHVVKKGQTLYSIARAYKIHVRTIMQVNQIRDATQVRVGTRLWIPRATRVVKVAPTDRAVKKKRNISVKGKKRPPIKNFLRWPVKGTLTSTFGKRRGRRHEGIDIGAPKGTPIVAAADGKVMFSDWGPTGYGLMVIIKHKNHLTTVYAHNSKNWVRKGMRVKKGQRIASVGSTGRSTGPHLHFEVRNDTHPRNPLKYLSTRR